VKLSIEGDSGKVTSATPMTPHDSGALGKCVSDALAKTVFPRFKSSVQGTTYPVSF